MKKIISISITIFFITTIGLSVYVWNHNVNQPASQTSEEVVYEIAPGMSFRSVAKELQQKNLIRNESFFIILAKIKRLGNKMKVGEYSLNKNMRPLEILNIISSGKSIERKITISEGLSIYEVAEVFDGLGLLSKEEFLKTITDPEFIQKNLKEDYENTKMTSLEGYLFPETYSFTKYTDAKTIISEMIQKFKETYKEIESESKITGLSKHQIVTLASIIEKETGAPQERPTISSVFHNRLKKKMRLQTDPTIIYGKALESKKIEINIKKSDILHPTPYNTYTIPGLPPGPIANPGKEALLAAVNPANSDYLFFVSMNDGTHVFTKEFKDHQSAVQKYQIDKKAREGKSWRDLNK